MVQARAAVVEGANGPQQQARHPSADPLGRDDNCTTPTHPQITSGG